MTTTVMVSRNVMIMSAAEVTRECPLIEIDLEEGNTSDFTAVQDPDDIVVIPDAALGGSRYGMEIELDDDLATHGDKILSSPSVTGIVRFRIYIDPHSLEMGTDSEFPFVYINSSSLVICSLWLHYNSGYYIYAIIYNDSGSSFTAQYSITDAPHYVEVELKRATSDVGNNGSLQLWIDGSSKETLSAKDNFDRFSDFNGMSMGIISGAYFVGSNSGTLQLDEFIANNTGTLIGAR